MERVLVIGCAGVGKTHFSKALAARTGLPLVHLDRHFWRAGWVAPEAEAWRQRVDALTAEPRWIMDGNYGGTLERRLPRADTVFFLDLPRRLSLFRVLRRTLRHRGRVRPDLAEGCPERFDLAFLRYIWNYRAAHRPHVLARLADFEGALVTFRTRREIEAYLAE